MSAGTVRQARRNAAVIGATGVTFGALFLFPTSTNSAGARLRPGQAAAPAGVVTTAAKPHASATAGAATSTVVVNGASADTQFGPVQVQLKVRAGRIVSAIAIDYPQGGGRDREINGYAIPILQDATIRAQSARIDSVSGATYTSDGYQRSLQSALDAAHLR